MFIVHIAANLATKTHSMTQKLTMRQMVVKANGCGMFQAVPAICTRPVVETPERMELIKAGMKFSEHPDEWLMFV